VLCRQTRKQNVNANILARSQEQAWVRDKLRFGQAPTGDARGHRDPRVIVGESSGDEVADESPGDELSRMMSSGSTDTEIDSRAPLSI